ncbi:MAG: class A beta-lactamase-related serine hydrolase [FCB group bacterium]|nr:class A beta-lactamase-related serine hydrolase [FCB group bacterium]
MGNSHFWVRAIRAMIGYVLIIAVAFSGELVIPAYYRVDHKLSRQLQTIVAELELDGDFDVGEDGIEQISLAVIDLSKRKPRLGGVNMDNFIYPASVYKIYVAAEVLHQISLGEYGLYDPYIVRSPNDVDRSKNIPSDPRPLLRDGDTVTVNHLLDLMITRSDNASANCLIDLARRENINALMHAYNWQGSEVTRKFLNRRYEDPGYEGIRGTETCALHAADLMYRVYSNQLVNPWVSMQMKSLLARQQDKSKLAAGLPPDAMFYHKSGWFSYWTNDVGIVDNGKTRYVIACFLPLRQQTALEKHHELSARIFELMSSGK